MRNGIKLICAFALASSAVSAWYLTAKNLRQYSRHYLSSISYASHTLGGEFTPELVRYKALVSSTPAYLDVVGLYRLYEVRSQTVLGREIDGSRNAPEAADRVVLTVASDVIERAEAEIAIATASIVKQAESTEAGSASLTPFIQQRVDEMLAHWKRAEQICQLNILDGSGLLCPTDADTRFTELAETIGVHGEPGLLLTPEKSSAKLVYPEIFELEFCNSAPYPVEFFRSDGVVLNGRTQLGKTSIMPGECSPAVLGKKEPALYVAARPRTGDKALTQIEAASGRRTGFDIPSQSGKRLLVCEASGGSARVISTGPEKPCRMPMELAKISFRVTGGNRNNYPVRLATFEVSDSWIAERTARTTFVNHALRRDHARILYGTLLNRQYWLDNPNKVPWYSIGVQQCDGDDEFSLGVKICSAQTSLPHGADPMVYAGETIMSVNDVPVFSLHDVRSVLSAISRVSRLDKPVRVGVANGYREGLLMFNPRAFGGCPFESGSAVFASFVRSLTMTLSDFAACSGTQGTAREACYSDQYEAALKRTQFCSTEDFWGSAAGAVGSVGAVVGKTLAKGLLRGSLRSAALAALRSSIGVAAIAALEEYTYAFMASPPVSPATPLIERAAPSMAVGFILAFITTR